MARADQDGGRPEVEVVGGGEDQLYEEVAGEAESDEGGEEAEVLVGAGVQSGPRVTGVEGLSMSTFMLPYFFLTSSCYLE